MKIYLSKTPSDRAGFVWVNDIHSLDSIVNDSEATHIVVDNFFSGFNFKDLGMVLGTIFAKMRIGCSIVFYQLDIDILSHQYSRMAMDIGAYNELLFREGAVSSVFNTESLCDLIAQAGLQIETKEINYDTFQCMIIARRNP
jgi:hypothetical protein